MRAACQIVIIFVDHDHLLIGLMTAGTSTIATTAVAADTMTNTAYKEAHGQVGGNACNNIGVFVELRIMAGMTTAADGRIRTDHGSDEVVIAVLVPRAVERLVFGVLVD